MSAKPANGIRRGSATINLAPLSLALTILDPIMGCCSMVLLPMTNIHSAPSTSGMELVMAPLPKALISPTTVEAWQSLAQWSILLVPIAALANFMKRKFSSLVHLAEDRRPIESGPKSRLISPNLLPMISNAFCHPVSFNFPSCLIKGFFSRSLC